MSKIIGISERDRSLIQEVVSDILKDRLGSSSQGRGRESKSYLKGVNTYIAKTREDGIPEIDEEQDPVRPGWAPCDIYTTRFVENGYDSYYELVNLEINRPVLNLSGDEIDGDSFISVHRSKHGDWVAAVSPSPGRVIGFQIDSIYGTYGAGYGYGGSVICPNYVEATVFAAPCSGTPNIGDIVTVYDPAGCFFNVPSEELFDDAGNGLRGYAAKLKFDYDGGYSYDGDVQCNWAVMSLCCRSPI